MRIVKNAEDRKNEILDVAEELFSINGFDSTSTNDIIKKIGIARGTLYYHFKSKEDIMDSLIERKGVAILQAAKKIAQDKSIPVTRRIIHTIMALSVKGDSDSDSGSGSGMEMIEHIHRPQNALMHQKVHELLTREVPPILTEIIKQGIEEGLFNTPYPYESMEMIVVYANAVFDASDDAVQMTAERRMARIDGFIFNLERMLGAQTGSLLSVKKIFEDKEGVRNHE